MLRKLFTKLYVHSYVVLPLVMILMKCDDGGPTS